MQENTFHGLMNFYNFDDDVMKNTKIVKIWRLFVKAELIRNAHKYERLKKVNELVFCLSQNAIRKLSSYIKL